MRNELSWNSILVACGVTPTTANIWAPAFALLMTDDVFAHDLEISEFLGEILHESSHLESISENLNYTPQGLLSTFGKRITQDQANTLGRTLGHGANQQVIANLVYGGDWGLKNLGNTLPTDGWNFRGSSPTQITGRSAFTKIGRIAGIDLVNNPDLARTPGAGSLKVAITWWCEYVSPSEYGDVVAIRRLTALQC